LLGPQRGRGSSAAMAAVVDPVPQIYQQMDEGNINVKDATRAVRLGFIRKVYGILSWQLLLTVAVAAPMQQLPRQWYVANLWLTQVSLVGSIVCILVLSCCPAVCKSYPTNYLFLFGFTLFESVLVGAVSAQYTAGAVCACAAATCLIFFGMTAYAWTTKSDFTGAGPYLFAALLALFALGCTQGILSMFGIQTPMLHMLYSAIGVVLFTMFIVYDTQLIIGEYKGHKKSFTVDEYVPAALNLYLDVINLFMDLLSLLGSEK